MTYTVPHTLPRFIERGKPATLTLRVSDAAGATVAPTAGTVQLFDPGGDGAWSPAKAVSIVDNVAQVSIVAGDTSGLDLAEGWVEQWDLTIAGDVETFRREAALVRFVPRPVITDLDLERVHRGLNAWRPGSQTSWEPQRTEAWDQLQARLIGNGDRPNLVVSSWALRNVHLYWTLFLIAELLIADSQGGRWNALLDRWAKRTEGEWNALNFRYDRDDDGTADGSEAAVPDIIFGAIPGR